MKNKLFKGLFGFLAVLFLFAVTDVYAVDSETLGSVTEGSNSASQNVTIGEVEIPVYEVVIIWQDLTFNWVYDEQIGDFDWKKPGVCSFYSDDKETAEKAISLGMKLYKDSECSERTSVSDQVVAYYFISEADVSSIMIQDYSENGQIVPSVSWESNEKYDYVNANLTYDVERSVCTVIESQDVLDVANELDVTIYSDSECSSVVINNPTSLDSDYYVFRNRDFSMPITGEIPDEARFSAAGSSSEYDFTETVYGYGPKDSYHIGLSLENDPFKEATTPVAGDVIGTVTISIRAK